MNYIVSHDGFTLRDLTAYTRDDQQSWDCRDAGASAEQTEELRERQQRNFLLTLLTSLGVPLLLGGSEFGRTRAPASRMPRP